MLFRSFGLEVSCAYFQHHVYHRCRGDYAIVLPDEQANGGSLVAGSACPDRHSSDLAASFGLGSYFCQCRAGSALGTTWSRKGSSFCRSGSTLAVAVVPFMAADCQEYRSLCRCKQSVGQI